MQVGRRELWFLSGKNNMDFIIIIASCPSWNNRFFRDIIIKKKQGIVCVSFRREELYAVKLCAPLLLAANVQRSSPANETQCDRF